MAFRRPRSPIGLHQHAVVGSHEYPKRYGSYQAWLQYLYDEWNLGLYLVLSEAGSGSLDIIEWCAQIGIEPVLRIQTDGGHPHPGLGIDRQQVRNFVSAGAIYLQVGNEPDNKGEWDGDDNEGGKQHGLGNREALVHQFMHNAEEIEIGGGVALLLPMTAGYPDYNTDTGEVTDDGLDKVSHLNFFKDAARLGYLPRLIDMAKRETLACAVHNRPSNHPPDYPNDVTCRKDPSYFQNKYPQFAKDPMSRLKNDSTCFKSYELIDDINIQFLGRSVPMFGTEAGYTIEIDQDSRYPKSKNAPLSPAGVYDDFSTLLEGNKLTVALEWSHSDLNLELMRRFTGRAAWRENLYGLCFYHALGSGGPDSSSEGWYENGLIGIDLEIITTLPAWIDSGHGDTVPPVQPVEPPPGPTPHPPDPIPPTPPTRPENHMLLRPMGIHGNNYPAMNTEDLEILYRINPSVVLLCQDDFKLIPQIRNHIPDITIIGRVFGDYALQWDSWHPPWDDNQKLFEYGRWAGRLATQWELDILQYANEPGVDDMNSFWFNEAGYLKLAEKIPYIVRGIRDVSRVKIGTIPLSPGHNEDDNPNNFSRPGGEILKPAFDLHDVWLFHNYWSAYSPGSHLSEWFGQRHVRQRAIYHVAESGKPWYITEWNRDERIIPGDTEMIEFATETEAWHKELVRTADRLYGGNCMYLNRSGDPAFNKMQLYRNRWLQDKMQQMNATSTLEVGKGPMNIVTKWPAPMPVATAGQSIVLHVELHENTLDGPLAKITGGATATLMLPRTPEDYAYPGGIDPITMDPEVEGEDVDGKLQLTFAVPAVQLPSAMPGSIRMNFVAVPNYTDSFEAISPPIIINPAGTPTTPTAPPTEPGMIGGVREDRLDWLLARIWEAKDANAAWATFMDLAYRWAKGEIPDMPAVPTQLPAKK